MFFSNFSLYYVIDTLYFELSIATSKYFDIFLKLK